MPDKRHKGETEYSTHPPTQRVRRRLLNMTTKQRAEQRTRSYEYSAIRSCCMRVSQREDYHHATINNRREMLLTNVNSLMARRRELGKPIFGLNEEAIVDRHLKKEADLRASKRGSKNIAPCLKGISVDSRAEAATNSKDASPQVQGNPPTPDSMVDNPKNWGIDNSPLPLNVNIPPEVNNHSQHDTDVSRLAFEMGDMGQTLARLNDIMHFQSNQLRVQSAQIASLTREVRHYRLNSRSPQTNNFPSHQRFFPPNYPPLRMYDNPPISSNATTQFGSTGQPSGSRQNPNPLGPDADPTARAQGPAHIVLGHLDSDFAPLPDSFHPPHDVGTLPDHQRPLFDEQATQDWPIQPHIPDSFDMPSPPPPTGVRGDGGFNIPDFLPMPDAEMGPEPHEEPMGFGSEARDGEDKEN